MSFYSLDWQIILSAFILDLVLGDPRWFPHPVILIGRLITSVEKDFRKFMKGRTSKLLAGGVLALIVPLTAFSVVYWLIFAAKTVSLWTGWLSAAFLGYTTIAVKSLYEEPLKVTSLLAAGDINGARKELSYLVGRDTHDLDEKGIVRALVETVAENTSDGVIAPLFYLAIGGPPLAMAYKAVNTLDSMVGYKSERYLYFGRASARLDDVVNYIPARLTAILIVFAAFVSRKNWKGALRIMLRDRRNHPSPNSGYPESAMAGAIGRRLGGLSYYGGVASNKPFIGDEHGEFQVGDVKDAGRLMITSSILMVLISMLFMAASGLKCIN